MSMFLNLVWFSKRTWSHLENKGPVETAWCVGMCVCGGGGSVCFPLVKTNSPPNCNGWAMMWASQPKQWPTHWSTPTVYLRIQRIHSDCAYQNNENMHSFLSSMYSIVHKWGMRERLNVLEILYMIWGYYGLYKKVRMGPIWAVEALEDVGSGSGGRREVTVKRWGDGRGCRLGLVWVRNTQFYYVYFILQFY
jgi:hypothetical protein